MEKDVENFVRVKLQGVRIRLRKGVLPHRFECQKALKVAPSTERAAKRQRVSLIHDLLHQPSTSSDVVIIPDAPVPDVVAVPDMRLSFDKTTQADLKKPHRSIRINCSIKSGTVDMGCQASFEDAPSPVAPAVNPSTVALSPAASFEPSFETESDTDLPDEDSDYVDEVDPGSDYEPEEDEDQEKKQMRACMVRAVMKDTLMCFGIPQKISYMIDFLAAKSKSPVIDVMITLKKFGKMNHMPILPCFLACPPATLLEFLAKHCFRLPLSYKI